MKKIFIPLILLVVAFAADSKQEALIKNLEQSLIAPCCWSGTVYDHGHPQMEQEIRQMVLEGRTRQEIIDHYVAQYGERILATPRASGFNLMAWIIPVLIALVGIFIFINYLRTPRTVVTTADVKNNKAVRIPHDDQIERELKALD